jgi:hypothetical protein
MPNLRAESYAHLRHTARQSQLAGLVHGHKQFDRRATKIRDNRFGPPERRARNSDQCSQWVFQEFGCRGKGNVGVSGPASKTSLLPTKPFRPTAIATWVRLTTPSLRMISRT